MINKEKLNKKIKSLELQIKAMTEDIHKKWEIRSQMEKDLFNTWQEKEGTKLDAEQKDGE